MKKILCFIFLLALSMLAANSFAEDFIVGEVVELSADKKIIQICDSMYRADQVYFNNGVDPITKSSQASIFEGSIVQLYPSDKISEYRLTEKVIVLTGRAKDSMIETYGITCGFLTNQSIDQIDD